MPFRIALSGLNAASTDLEVTGNNIANAATNGFKESRAEFADLYANSIQDQSSTAAGRGVRVAQVAQQFHQGSIDFTSNNLDLAISGDGFFVLHDADGTQTYTRAGAYRVDKVGNVVNHKNQHLQVYPALTGVGGATTFSTGVLSNLQLPIAPSAPNPTSSISAALNLDSSNTVPPVAFDPASPSTYNSATSTTVYDSLGNTHTATMYFVKAGANAWNGHLALSNGAFGTPLDAVHTNVSPAFALGFDSAGNLTTPASGQIDLTGNLFTPATGATPLSLTMDLTGTSQYGSNFAVNNLTQNGYTSGRLASVDVDTEGVVFARYTNGESDALGKVSLAKFNNAQGLRQLGDTNWGETFSSGNAQLGEAGTSSFGQIQSGALEASNVDIAAQLVNLITAQRNFQANAEVISTADTVTQTIINIR